MIYKSTEYDEFAFFEINRELQEGFIKKLMRAMKEENYLEENPILCTPDKKIIDGQHRFIACKNIGGTLYYRITHKDPVKLMRALNAIQHTWKIRDFLKSYPDSDVCQKILEIEEEYGISSSLIVRTFNRQGKSKRKLSGEIFRKDLELDLPLYYIENYVKWFASIAEEAADLETKKTAFKKSLYFECLLDFYKIPDVDHEHLRIRMILNFPLLNMPGNRKQTKELIVHYYNMNRKKRRIAIDAKGYPYIVGK